MLFTDGLKQVLHKIQDDRQNKLLVERDGAVVEDIIYKGKISNIFLNKYQDLEISFEVKDQGTGGNNHVTIPIKDQLEAQRALNEPVYIKIDVENEKLKSGVEEMIFKVLPEGKIER